MDFWDNVSVNLFSNVLWVLLAYASMQVFKRIVAARRPITPLAPGDAGSGPPPVELPPAETPKELIRRVARSVFQLAGLLIFMLLICSSFVDSAAIWRHVVGWTMIAGVWASWFWCTRDPRASHWLRSGDATFIRVLWWSFAIAFWAVVLGGLAYVTYGIS